MMVVRARVCAVVMASVLTGSCASLGPVRGIPPTLQVTDVERASGNVQRILRALADDTGIQSPRQDMWYLVAEAGFNYIDDRCSNYFYSLFRLNRRKEAVKSGLGVFGTTTNAILQATGATTVSMTIVAQAFGLASAMTDIVAGTFLFELPPATTREFVFKMQRAFRAGAALDKAEIDTPTRAYHVIQDYLALCLPATIEARLVGHVATAKPAPTREPGANIGIIVGSQVKVPPPLRPIASARDRPRPVPPLRPRSCLPTPYELGLQPGKIDKIQNAVCLTPDGKLGDETRRAVYDLLRGVGKDRPDILSCGIAHRDSNFINKAITRADEKTCVERGYTDAYKVGRSLR